MSGSPSSSTGGPRSRVVFVAQLPEPGQAKDRRSFRDVSGTPTRARGCECAGVPLLDEEGDTCCFCGKYPEAEITKHWISE